MNESGLINRNKLTDILEESNSIKNIIAKTIVSTKANQSEG